MKFRDLYLGLRPWLDDGGLLELCARSNRFNSREGESVEGGSFLLLFEDFKSYRRSWLVKTNRRLYKVLDDRTDEKALINWSIDLETARKSDINISSILNGKLRKIAFSFRPGKEYLVDARLFQTTGVEDGIKSFIKN